MTKSFNLEKKVEGQQFGLFQAWFGKGQIENTFWDNPIFKPVGNYNYKRLLIPESIVIKHTLYLDGKKSRFRLRYWYTHRIQ